MALRDRRNHEESLLAFHVNILVNAFLSFKKQIEDTFGNSIISEAIKTNVSQLVTQVIYLTQANESGQQKIKEMNTKIGKLDENLGACGQSNFFSDIAFLKQQVQDQTIQLQERDRKLGNLEAKTQNYEFLLGEANRNIEEQAQEYLQLKKKLDEATENLRKLSLGQGYQRSEPLLRPTIVSWDEMPSMDGTLTWKITNFTQRQQEAITGRNTSFYSPTFYTSRYGYKMCARIYLNGDGMGKESHISLFFVVMRGEYDALLRWPFRQKVTMMILDQDNWEHKVDAFRPDPNSSSFQRPRREMNIASGCPLFCPLDELGKHAYVRDDVMFIKVAVDCTDL